MKGAARPTGAFGDGVTVDQAETSKAPCQPMMTGGIFPETQTTTPQSVPKPCTSTTTAPDMAKFRLVVQPVTTAAPKALALDPSMAWQQGYCAGETAQHAKDGATRDPINWAKVAEASYQADECAKKAALDSGASASEAMLAGDEAAIAVRKAAKKGRDGKGGVKAGKGGKGGSGDKDEEEELPKECKEGCYQAKRSDYPSCSDYEALGYICVGQMCAMCDPVGVAPDKCSEFKGNSTLPDDKTGRCLPKEALEEECEETDKEDEWDMSAATTTPASDDEQDDEEDEEESKCDKKEGKGKGSSSLLQHRSFDSEEDYDEDDSSNRPEA